MSIGIISWMERTLMASGRDFVILYWVPVPEMLPIEDLNTEYSQSGLTLKLRGAKRESMPCGSNLGIGGTMRVGKNINMQEMHVTRFTEKPRKILRKN